MAKRSIWDAENISTSSSTTHLKPKTESRSVWDFEDVRPSSATTQINLRSARPSDVQLDTKSLESIPSKDDTRERLKRIRIVVIIISLIACAGVVATAVAVPVILLARTTPILSTATSSVGPILVNGTTTTTSTATMTTTSATTTTTSATTTTATDTTTTTTSATMTTTSAATTTTSATTTSATATTTSATTTTDTTTTTSATTITTSATTTTTTDTTTTTTSATMTTTSAATTTTSATTTSATATTTSATTTTDTTTTTSATTTTDTTTTTSATTITTSATTTTDTTTTTTVSATTATLVNPCISGLYWNATATSRAGTGSSGAGLNQLSSPTGISFDSSDNLYVADGGNYRVLKYTPGVTNSTVIAGTTSVTGTTLNLFSTGMRYMYIDSSQNLYVSDTYNNRIMRWANGASTGVIVAGNGTYGTSLTQLYYPYGLWLDSSSNLFIAEYQNHRVTKWASGAATGILIAGITGSAGATPNKLSSPAGLLYDEANQDIYIANSGGTGATVMKWRVGAPNGTVVAGISGSVGSTATQLNSPMGIALDQWRNLYVADRSNNRVQFFCNGSSTGITIAGTGSGGTTLSAPYDVKLDSQLNVYVSENSAARVRKFTKM